MGLTSRRPAGGDYTPVEEGTHIARCVRLVDIGTQHNPKFGKDELKLILSWELPNLIIEDGEYAGMPRMISQRYTNSLHEKARLYQDLVAWRGRAFTDAELAGFDMRKIVGAACLLNVTHNVQGDRTYSNISAIMALPKGTLCPQQVHPSLIFDLEEPNMDVLAQLPEWEQQLIEQSQEWNVGLHKRPASTDVPPPSDDVPF